MKNGIILGLLLIGLTSQPLHAADGELANLLEADSSAVVLIDNLSNLLDSAEGHPLMRAWEDDDVRWAFSGLRRQLGLTRWNRIAETEIGYSPEELQQAFAGPAALVGSLFPDPQMPGVTQIHRGMIAKASDAEAAEALVRHQLAQPLWRSEPDEQFELVSEEFQGELLWSRRVSAELQADDFYAKPAYARVGDYLLVAEPIDYLKQLVTNLLEGEAIEPWSEVAGNRELLNQYPDADLHYSLSTTTLGNLLSEQLITQIPADVEIEADLREEIEQSNAQMRQLFSSLQLDNIESIAGAMKMGAEHTDLDLNIGYRDDTGLIRLLAYRPGPVEMPAFLPDLLTSASSTLFDLPSFWRTAQDLGKNLVELRAMTAQLHIQLGNLTKKHGIDLEQALLDGLGEEVITGGFPIEVELKKRGKTVEIPGMFFAISLDDQQAVNKVVATLAEEYGLSAKSDTLDYMDATVQVFWPETIGEVTLPNRPAYSVTDGYLLFASDLPVLQQAISRLRRPGDHTPALAGTALKTALDEIGPKASSVSYYQSGAVIDGIFDWLLDQQRSMAAREAGACKPRITLEAGALDGFIDGLTTATFKEPGRLHLNARMLHHAQK